MFCPSYWKKVTLYHNQYKKCPVECSTPFCTKEDFWYYYIYSPLNNTKNVLNSSSDYRFNWTERGGFNLQG
jgi:hypothetical protein